MASASAHRFPGTESEMTFTMVEHADIIHPVQNFGGDGITSDPTSSSHRHREENGNSEIGSTSKPRRCCCCINNYCKSGKEGITSVPIPGSSSVCKPRDECESHFTPELHALCLLALFHVNFVCGICNEALIDCICLECGHNFCSFCLNQWLSLNRVCPICYQQVKEEFEGGQRTYCVDEFVGDMYTSVQELSSKYFGNIGPLDSVSPPGPLTSTEIQDSIRHTRILNSTSDYHRQQLKRLRRNFMENQNPVRERDDFSLLEQQTELFAGPDNLTLAAIVQFFLSSITAFVTYEGGDGIDNDFVLVLIISVVVWSGSFITLMRLLGYEGTLGELLEYLQFIRFVEEGNDNEPQSGPNSESEAGEMNEATTTGSNEFSDIHGVQVRSSAPVRNASFDWLGTEALEELE